MLAYYDSKTIAKKIGLNKKDTEIFICIFLFSKDWDYKHIVGKADVSYSTVKRNINNIIIKLIQYLTDKDFLN